MRKLPSHPGPGNPPHPLKLVLLLQDLEFGGTQRYALHLLKHLDRKLFSPQLWVLRNGLEMAPLAREAGVSPFWLSRSSWVSPLALLELVRNLARERPHILYTLTVVPNIWGRLFGSAVQVPVIISSWRDLHPKQYESWMWHLSSRIICNAGMLKGEIVQRHKVAPQRIAVVTNGVDTDFFRPKRQMKAHQPTVLYLGRLSHEKGLFTLLHGFRRTLREIPEVRLLILGNGRLQEELARTIHRHSLEDRITLLPGTSDPRSYLNQSWVLALGSAREASPNVVLEAMASELPVVAPAVGGIPELVDHGRTGLLYEPGNVAALADNLIMLLKNPALQRFMGQQGRQKVCSCFTLEQMILKTEQVLLEAVRECRGT
jgi:glycosyltransferase involved in cell wall biosynthesis